ncbi:MAG TPA: aspartate aminotransferase family protein [Verrucomicrobiae bacterium]|nr:aspartate aminotransferase family protein [Verrucomicrobiae bacterium]
MPTDIKALVANRLGENYELHDRYVNRTLVKVQRTIGFDKVYARAKGAYLYDKEGHDYLDFLSGFGVYAMGRNHPAIRAAIQDVLDLDLPNMVQMDCAFLAGVLAEKLVTRLALQGAPHLDAVFLCNSGTEAVEGALKFARAATGRPRIIALENSYHGLSYGSLSVTGNPFFHEGFGPFLPGVAHVPMGDIEALERELAEGDVAAFIVEPVQGKGVKFPKDDYYNQAQALCRKHGALLICDEVQTGLGRTGRWFAFEHWNLEPDIITLAKALSGGYVPCGAIVARRRIYQCVFPRLDRCIVHSSTFGRNNLAAAAGIASLNVIEEEGLVENAARMGELMEKRLRQIQDRHEIVDDIRVKGLMCAFEMTEPRAFFARLGWKLYHAMDPGLFPQLVVTPLLQKHRILTQVAAHRADVVKFLPPLIIGEAEINRFCLALDDVLRGLWRIPGPLADVAANFFRAAGKGSPIKPELLRG